MTPRLVVFLSSIAAIGAVVVACLKSYGEDTQPTGDGGADSGGNDAPLDEGGKGDGAVDGGPDARQQPGTLDTTFGDAGWTAIDLEDAGNFDIDVNGMAMSADGRPVLVGTALDLAQAAVARFTSEGLADTTFGSNGIARLSSTFSHEGNAVVVRPDGRVVAGGTRSNAGFVAQLTTTGALDTFGTSGFALPPTPNVKSLGLTSTGAILLGYEPVQAGEHDIALMGIGSDGASFPSGSSAGLFSASTFVNATTTYADGRSLLVGASATGVTIVRFGADRMVDPTFGNGGSFSSAFADPGGVDSGYAIALQKDGRIVVVGRDARSNGTGTDLGILRVTDSGVLDTTFGNGGKLTLSFSTESYGKAAAIQDDGKILVAGYAYDAAIKKDGIAIARLLPNGQLDPTFADKGKLLGYPSTLNNFRAVGLGLQPGGKVVVGGMHLTGTGGRFMVVRYWL